MAQAEKDREALQQQLQSTKEEAAARQAQAQLRTKGQKEWMDNMRTCRIEMVDFI